MSVCSFLAADYSLPEVLCQKDYPLEIDLDKGIVFDGDADDAYSLLDFDRVYEYTNLKYGVALSWNYYTTGRAKRIIKYIQQALNHCAYVEIWKVWLAGENETLYPVHHYQEIPFDKLTEAFIKKMDAAEVWGNGYNHAPDYYCLAVRISQCLFPQA